MTAGLPATSCGGELQQSTAGAIALIFEQPDGAVGTLLHLANATAHVEALRFGCATVDELHAHQ